MKMKRKLQALSVVATLLVLALSISGENLSQAAAQNETGASIVTTRTDLLDAIFAAHDGETIYVGDIDFNELPPGWTTTLNSLKRVTINKNLVIKSGKPDGAAALLSGGSFVIDGPTRDSQEITTEFENIIFDGCVDGSALTALDWELVDTEPEPMLAQFAATFKGNVGAVFSNCVFTRYMNEYGGALSCRYGDYDWAAPGDIEYNYRDNKQCRLDLSLFDCTFSNNNAFYAGGALYLDSTADNVLLSAKNCNFERNNSSVGYYGGYGYPSWYGEGGGAIFARNAVVSLFNCIIEGNIGNRVYGSANSDGTYGGGVACFNGTLNMTNCTVADNVASVGGGISLLLTKTNIDGCVISGNRASTQADFFAEDWDFSDESNPIFNGYLERQLEGMQRSAGYAGGIYVSIEGPVPITIVNTEITQNTAQFSYGGFSAYYLDFYNPIDGPGSVNFVFCLYKNNTCEYEHDYSAEDAVPWFTLPGDIWEIPFVSAFGCIIVDDDFEEIFPRYEMPGGDNGYNYFAPPLRASEDGMLSDQPSQRYKIPDEYVKTILDGRFGSSVGSFFTGRNYNPEILFRLDAAGGRIDQREFTYVYGQTSPLPTPERRGYDFDGWRNADGETLNFEGMLFSVDMETYDVFAAWVPNGESVLPEWSIALIVLFSCLAVCFPILLVLRRRKLARAGSGGTNVSRAPSGLPASSGNDFFETVRQYNLTAKEKEIAALLIEGKTQKTIAEELVISTETVKTHVKNIYGKLGVKSKYELFAKLKA